MTTQLLAVNVVQATDAEFRTWVAAFIAGFVAAGLTQSSDTGQINTATVLAPTANNQNRGYWIGEPADALTKPKYKCSFGSGGNGALNPAVWIQVGWATDGAGTFTGTQLSTEIRCMLTAGNNGVTGCDIPICHQDSAFALLVNENNEGTNNRRSLIVIDRYRDVATGDATADGVAVWISSAAGQLSGGTSTNNYHQCIPATGGVGADRGVGDRFPGAYPHTTGTWGRGANVGVAPLVPWDAGGLAPSIASVFYSGTDAPTIGTTFSPLIYGTARTYRAVAGRADGTNGAVAILYE